MSLYYHIVAFLHYCDIALMTKGGRLALGVLLALGGKRLFVQVFWRSGGAFGAFGERFALRVKVGCSRNKFVSCS